jgi:TonB family protein
VEDERQPLIFRLKAEATGDNLKAEATGDNMHEAVSDILDLRMRESEGLSRMLVVSLVAHVVLLAALVFMPADWRGAKNDRNTVRMTISLNGGAPGPNAGGMTQMSTRPVQAVAPPEPKPRPETPPAAKKPEMTIPDPALKVKPVPPKVDKSVDKSAARNPTTGPKVTSGDARVNTGAAPIPFGGLSTSGGARAGGVKLDVGDFCCPEYIATMLDRIRANWNQNQGVAGRVIVKFTIKRDGVLTNVEVEQGTGNYLLDTEARRAILYTRQLPPLPAQFTEPTLPVHLTFDYVR